MIDRPPALLCGVPIANVTMDETLALVGLMIRRGRDHGVTHQIATVNVDFLVNALEDPHLLTILQRADVCLADGMPIVWAPRLLGMPVRERVAGSDLFPQLIEASHRSGHRIHVLGSSASVVARARGIVEQRWPNARVSFDPGPRIDDPESVSDEVIESISSLAPDILCVALGNPKQERFIAAHQDRLQVPVMIGIGGSVDMFVGARRRAPRWVQRVGLEWCFRAAQEPARLVRRYARDVRVFAPRLASEFARARRRHRMLSLSLSDGVVIVALGGLDSEVTWTRAAGHLRDGHDLEFHCLDHDDLAASALAQAVGLAQIARWTGTRTTWTGDVEDVPDVLRTVMST